MTIGVSSMTLTQIGITDKHGAWFGNDGGDIQNRATAAFFISTKANI
jgi:hypothetical protein